MTKIALSNFNGLVPRTGKANLNPEAAQIATNVKLYSGEICAWKAPTVAYRLLRESAQTIFKLEGPSGEGVWAEFVEDTDIVFSPVADMNERRIYYSENGVCKKTNWRMAHDGPDNTPYPRNWLYMGVPRPEWGPTLETAKEDYEADNTENRAYVWTWVSEFGNVQEESAPSDARMVVCDIVGAPVKVSGFPKAPTDHYNIRWLRLYRAVAGSSNIVYMMVDQFDVKNGEVQTDLSYFGIEFEDGVYNDSRKAEQLSITMESMYYEEPPKGLRGLVNMPNGMIAGFVGNQVWFCEPYLPHAWPSTYMLTTDSQIVGLGVYGNTLVVCTERQPFTVAGTHPSAMTQEKLPMVQPCVNKRSIAYDQYGVLYASANGLVVVAGGQMDVFTRPIMTRDDWQEYNPELMVGTMYNNQYMCAYRTATENGVLVFSRGDTPALIKLDFAASCLYVERVTGEVYGLCRDDNVVYKLDSSEVNYLVYQWKSKYFVYPRSLSFSCAKLDGEYGDDEEIAALNVYRNSILEKNGITLEEREGQCFLGCIDDAELNRFTLNGGLLFDVPEEAKRRSVMVQFFADDELIYEREVNDPVAFRIPPVNAYNWEVQINGQIPIRGFEMATSMAEL